MNYNRQQKRAMAKQGLSSSPRPSEPRRSNPAEAQERTSPKRYLSEVRSELRKVDWPKRPEVTNSSIVVLVMVVIMTLLIFGFDWLSERVVNLLIR
ncbi:MAG: preprotein translocase subunit SecE [Acidimicrobiia bacterium]